MNAWLKRLVAILALLMAGGAAAHELSMAELELREAAPNVFRLQWSAGEKRPPAEELILGWPEGCVAEDGLVRCGDKGLTGTLSVKGIGKSYSAALVKVFWQGGESQVYALTPSQPRARLFGPKEQGSAGAYLSLGIEHILQGVDHLLFVLGLLLIVANRWTLIKTVSAFTLAHSLTLAVATLGVAHVPAAPLNATIALSILFLGPEVVRCWRGETSFTIRHPWVVAFAFGLLHGFGFASGLAQLGLPQDKIPLALLMFNMGVEIGQLGFVLGILLLQRALRLLAVPPIIWLERLPGYLVGTLGAYWTIQRFAMLLRGVA